MKFLAVNGSPRRQKNTGRLLAEMVKGAKETGAEAELAHLRDLEPFKGCISQGDVPGGARRRVQRKERISGDGDCRRNMVASGHEQTRQYIDTIA